VTLHHTLVWSSVTSSGEGLGERPAQAGDDLIGTFDEVGPRDPQDPPSGSGEGRVSGRIRLPIEERRMVATAVEFDEDPGGRIGDIDPPDPVVGVPHVELTHRFGKPGITHEIPEAGLELARGRHVALGSDFEQATHDGHAFPASSGQLNERDLERPGRGDAHGQAVVEGAFRPRRVKDPGEIADRPGHSGGWDALDDGQMVIGKEPPPVNESVAVAVSAGPGRDDLDQASSVEARNPEECGGRSMGRSRERARRQDERVKPLLPGSFGPREAVDTRGHQDPTPAGQAVLDRPATGAQRTGLSQGEQSMLCFSQFRNISVYATS